MLSVLAWCAQERGRVRPPAMDTRRDAALASYAQKLVEGDMGPGIAHDSRSGSDALTDRRAEADFRRYAAERFQVGVGVLQWHVRRTTNEPYMGEIQGQRNVYAHLQNTIEPPSRHAS